MRSNPRRAVTIFAFYLLPLFAGGFTVYLIAAPNHLPALARWGVFPAFLVSVIALAGLVVSLRILLDAARRRNQRMRAELKSAVALRQTREAQLGTLQKDVELLSAIREIGVIVNADNEFQDVLTKVLEVVGGAVRAQDLVLYLVDQDSRDLEPVARRFQGKAYFKRNLKNPPTASGRITEALEHGRMMKDFCGGTPVLTLPLVVDREAVGALKVTLLLDEEGEDAIGHIRHSESFLQGLQRHLSLAIKAPSLYNRAVIDALTGLYSRRHFDNQLAGHFKISQRRSSPLGFILVDIDHFKNVNDTFGHPTGDLILGEVARIMQKEIREYDTAYRYGGEEMCVILPQTGEEDTHRIAERIREKVEKKVFRSDRRKEVPLTLSLGVGAYAPWMTEPGQIVDRTDKALYRAKDNGRNRVEMADLTEASPDGSGSAPGPARPAKAPRKAAKKKAPKKKAAKKGRPGRKKGA